MLTIGRLRIVLPPGFAGRPERVARLVAEELARLPLPEGVDGERIARLAPPPVAAGPRPGEAAVAGAAARAIHQTLADRR